MRKMFSKNQIAEMIGDNLLEDQVVNVKELKEEFDTELIDLTSYINSGFAKSNSIYAKLIVKHNLLIIILSGNFVAASNDANPIILNNFIDVIPSSIKNKIYRMDGTNLTEEKDSLNFIAFTPAPKRINSTLSMSSLLALQSTGPTNIQINGFGFSGIAEDAVCQLDGRFILTL